MHTLSSVCVIFGHYFALLSKIWSKNYALHKLATAAQPTGSKMLVPPVVLAEYVYEIENIKSGVFNRR